MKKMRTEADSIGEMEVPVTAYYGVQALRARQNFPITYRPLHSEFIKSMAKLKKASAIKMCIRDRLKESDADIGCFCDRAFRDCGKIRQYPVDRNGAGLHRSYGAQPYILYT